MAVFGTWQFKHLIDAASTAKWRVVRAIPNTHRKPPRELLNRLKQLLVLRQKSAARSQLKLAIEDAMTPGFRGHRNCIGKKCSAVFEHMYESFPEREAGVYAVAA